MQRRYTQGPAPARLQQRADGSGSKLPMITGYAAVFYKPGQSGTEYELWDNVVERIRPGAFNRAIREDDVRALFNHDSDHLLGRTVSKTLRLSVDSVGLRYEIDPPDTPTAREVVELLKRGDLTGSSFAFLPTAVEHRDENGLHVVYIAEVMLADVGPVTYPAYSATEAGVSGRTSPRRSVDSTAAADAARIAVTADLMELGIYP